MKADWDDAPLRVRKRNKNTPFIVALVMVVGIASLTLYATNHLPNVVKNLELADKARQAIHENKPSAQMADNPYRTIVKAVEDPYLEQVNRMLGITDDYVSEPVAEIEWSNSVNEKSAPDERQTSYTDSNYTQPATVNTVRMPRPAAQPAEPARRQQPYVTVVKETRQSCWPFREGSAECRKHKSQLYQINSRNCLNSGDSQSVSCRQAKRYDLR